MGMGEPGSPLAAFYHSIHEKLEEVLAPTASSVASEKKAQSVCQFYSTLIPQDKSIFLTTLAANYGVDNHKVHQISSSLSSAQDRGVETLLRAQEKLRQALVPRYQALFSQISALDSGVKFLVDLRTDILGLVPSTEGPDVHYLKTMNSCLRDLLTLWFSVGILNLERITWESPCDMVQKISSYEVVHPIRNWLDVKRRVGSYRRCFVFTHNSMPREPLVVLNTALTSGISNSIQSIVQSPQSPSGSGQTEKSPPSESKEEDPECINTAIFYSIISTQKGLQGVELGNYLIKRVVRELQYEYPSITQFSSLSPIPGFRDWLMGRVNSHLHHEDEDDSRRSNLFQPSEVCDLCEALECSESSMYKTLKKLLATNAWIQNERTTEAFKRPLIRLCARYLYLEKHRGFALNPVAHFHLKNGAVMWRINWLADVSPRGLTASCGLMVNYRYYLDQTESNSENYMERQTITAAEQVLLLAEQTER